MTIKRVLFVGVVLAVGAPAVGAEKAASMSQPTTQPTSRPAVRKELTLKLADEVSMKLVLIPAGKFMMGSPKGEKNGERDERPQREVTLTRSFYMGVTEVTQSQYAALSPGHKSGNRGPDLPVERVSWAQAKEFCKKLAERSGRKARLPTEAEWEYACRAGSKGRFSFGEADAGVDAYGWHKGNAGGGTHLVGQKKPNAWGLYDVYGNVCEWVLDYHGRYHKLKKIDPTGPAAGAHPVLRGGSYRNPASFLRSANRAGADPKSKRPNLGLRVVVEVK